MSLTLLGGATSRDFQVASESVRGVRVRRDIAAELTSVHVAVFEVEINKKKSRKEEVTRDIPNVGAADLEHIDDNGVIREGSEVRPGTILIGRVEERGGTMLSPEEKLLRAIFGEAAGDVRDTSVRCSPDVKGRVTETSFEASKDHTHARVTVTDERTLRIGDVLEIDGTRTVVTAIVDDQRSELVWDGASGTLAVAKVESAETILQARSIGPYSLVTQQPFGTKATFAGQRVDEAKLRALESAGAWFAAAEMLTIKCDDVPGRTRFYEGIVKGDARPDFGRPQSADVLLRELRALGFDVIEEEEGAS